MSNPFAGKPLGGTMNPLKRGFWNNNALLSPANLGAFTGAPGARNLIGSSFKGGGASVGDDSFKPLSPGAKDKIKTDEEKAGADAKASAEAAAKQAEFEASTRAGLERLALKRKRGFGASMLVTPTLGSSSTLGS